jgi:isoaspartyl peptidase/L-asparaginase-like protein (Ntn-hydrolase superfamily)
MSCREISSDTIGVLVRSSGGEFAGALSTGGTTLTLRGRVGDVPIQGAGLYVGPKGAVACTGNGEDSEAPMALEDDPVRRVSLPIRASAWRISKAVRSRWTVYPCARTRRTPCIPAEHTLRCNIR